MDMSHIYENWPANHKGDKAPSKKILQLGKKITDVVAHKAGVKVEDPEYWGLAEIITEEMADVALKMKLRTPTPSARCANSVRSTPPDRRSSRISWTR